MTLNEIECTLRELRLSGIAATLNTRVMQAQASQQPLLETLAGLLQDEFDRRDSPALSACNGSDERHRRVRRAVT